MGDNVYQLNLFNFDKEKKVITKPIRLIELFSDIGAQAKALEILGVPFEHWKTCEWAFNSIKSYNAIHIKDFIDYSKDLTKEQLIAYLDGNISTNYDEPCNIKKKKEQWLRDCYNNCIATHNLMNIMKVHGKDLEIVDTDKYEYIMTYSFPCQDLSLAGKRAGMEISQADGGTRSGLLWEVGRILDELDDRPQILLMENVPEVIGKDNVKHFNKWLDKLESLGYTNYFSLLNAKDFGIPQNRKRCFMVSILGEYAYDFPLKLKLKYRLKHFLKKQVPKRYYLTKKMIKYILDRTPIGEKDCKAANNIRSVDTDKCAGTITTKGGNSGASVRSQDTFIVDNMTQEEIDVEIYGKPQKYTKKTLERISKNVIKGDIVPCITANAMQSIGHQNCALVKVGLLGSTNGHQSGNFYDENGIAHTLTACDYKSPPKVSLGEKKNLRIRKLVPQETMALMGFEPQDELAMREVGMSDSAIYHCSGDSIVTTVLCFIFGQMLFENEKELYQQVEDYIETLPQKLWTTN